jgi:hypothetical protein
MFFSVADAVAWANAHLAQDAASVVTHIKESP